MIRFPGFRLGFISIPMVRDPVVDRAFVNASNSLVMTMVNAEAISEATIALGCVAII